MTEVDSAETRDRQTDPDPCVNPQGWTPVYSFSAARLGRSGTLIPRIRYPNPFAILRALTARPASADQATLIAMADTDEVVWLRLLRAIRDLGVG